MKLSSLYIQLQNCTLYVTSAHVNSRRISFFLFRTFRQHIVSFLDVDLYVECKVNNVRFENVNILALFKFRKSSTIFFLKILLHNNVCVCVWKYWDKLSVIVCVYFYTKQKRKQFSKYKHTHRERRVIYIDGKINVYQKRTNTEIFNFVVQKKVFTALFLLTNGDNTAALLA